MAGEELNTLKPNDFRLSDQPIDILECRPRQWWHRRKPWTELQAHGRYQISDYRISLGSVHPFNLILLIQY